MKSLDEALEEIGDFGNYQRRLYFLLVFTAIFPVMQKWIWTFSAAIPPHRCKLPFEVADNATAVPWTYEFVQDDNFTVTTPKGNKRFGWNPCDFHDDNTTRHSIGWNIEGHSILERSQAQETECTSWIYDDSQFGVTASTEFDLVCERRVYQTLGWLLYIVGEIAGYIIWGALADRFGRKKIFFLSLALQALAGLLSGMVASLSGVLAMRTALGLFSPSCFIGAVLRLEFIGPSMRMMAAMADCASASLGLIALATLSYFFREWRKLQIVVSIPGFLFLSCWWFVPESARWYLAQKRERDGRKIISKMANENRRDITLDTYEADEPDKGNIIQLNPINLCCFSSSRKRLFILCFVWLCNSISFYYLMSKMPVFTENLILHFILNALAQLPSYVICLFTLNRFGKKYPILITLVTSAVIIGVLASIPSHMVILEQVLTILAMILLNSAYSAIYVYSMELHATVVRGSAIGFNYSARAVGELLVPWVALTSSSLSSLPLALCAGLPSLAGIVSLLLPETTGQYMPETLQDVEMINTEDDMNFDTYSEQDGSFSIVVPLRPMKDEEEKGALAPISARNSIS